MTQYATAVFENNRLSLLTPLKDIPEHSVVETTVEPVTRLSREELLAALEAVPVAEELADTIEKNRETPWPVEEF